jgi:hypothetical protein
VAGAGGAGAECVDGGAEERAYHPTVTHFASSSGPTASTHDSSRTDLKYAIIWPENKQTAGK